MAEGVKERVEPSKSTVQGETLTAIHGAGVRGCASGQYFSTTSLELLYRCCWTFWDNILLLAEERCLLARRSSCERTKRYSVDGYAQCPQVLCVPYLTLS